MKIKTIAKEASWEFDEEVNQALEEGYTLTSRRLIGTPAGTRDYHYAELVQLDPLPEPQEIDPMAAVRAIRDVCERQKSCGRCPLTNLCDHFFVGSPCDWDMPEEAAP